jgi:glutamine cyclotransferase
LHAIFVDCLLQIGTFKTPLQDGWGITADDQLLVLSDGSNRLTWVDPKQNFKAVKTVQVMDGNKPVNYLNEVGGRGM